MSSRLDRIKEFLKKGNSNEGQTNRPNNYYPFWNMKVGEQAVIRFLPDTNSDNPAGFFVEKLMHSLDVNGEKKSVPCLKMYEDECPICKVSSSYYKEEGKGSPNGKKYWRKKQHIAQALIIEDPLPADEQTGENYQGKVRFIALGFQLFEVIKAAFESGDLLEAPEDFKKGYNFVIKKTKQGEYDTYALGSRFKPQPTELSDEDIAVLEEQMVDLSTLLPKHPGMDKVEGLLEAALTGAAYEEDSTSSVAESETKPTPAVTKPSVAKPAVAKPAVAKPAVAKPASLVAKPAPAAASATTDTDGDDEGYEEEADKILAQIKARRAAQQS